MDATTMAVLAFLATYAVHSTLLLGAAALLGRWVARGEAWRETLWKAALVGAVATASLAQVAPWSPVEVGVELVTAARAPALEPEAPGVSAGTPESSHATPAGTPTAPRPSTADPATTHQATTDPAAADPAAADPAVADAARGGARPADGSLDRTAGPGEGAVGAPQAEVAATPDIGALVAWLVGAWAVIAGLLLARLGWRHARLFRVLRSREPVTDGGVLAVLAELRRSAGVWVPVRLTSTSAIASPLVLGRWEICVPERLLTELGAEERRAALAHELAHLARRDPAWQLGAMLLECVFFFQPLQRVARRGLRESAEYLADGWAVRHTGGRLSLARCLAEVASWVAPAEEPVLAGTVAMAEGGSPLLVRVSRLLEREPEPEPRSALRLACAVALVALVAGFGPVIGVAEGVPGLSGDEVAAGLPAADEDSRAPAYEAAGAQEPLEVLRFDRPGREGDGFVARLNEAGRDAGAAPYWVAYAVDAPEAGARVVIDSEQWSTGQLESPALVARLGLEDEPWARARAAGSGGSVLVLARLVPSGPATRVARLAVRRPEVGMPLSGRVYWLGVADPESSFRWLRDVYAAVGDRELRETVVEAAAVHPAAGVPAFLRRALESDASGDVRREAVEGLALRPDTLVARLLLELALTDADPEMRREAAESMERLAPEVAVPLLLRVALEGDEEAASQAAETLGDVGTSAALAALEEVLARPVPEEVAHQAVEAVTDFPANLAVPVLERISRSHRLPGVRREAMEELIDAAGGASIDGERLLAIAMRDDDPDLRREAVERLADLPAAQAVPLLRRVAFESGDGTAERQAAESLGDVGTLEALAVLDEIIARNPGEDASFQAVESIAEEFRRDLAAPRLAKIAREHPSSRVRREALDRLGELGGG